MFKVTYHFVFACILLFCATHTFAQTSVMDFYNAKVKAMSTADMGGGSFKLNITKKDVANGYLAYNYSPALGYMAGVTKSPEEMAYFTAKNGKKFVAVASFSCVEGIPCYAQMPKFFTLENGVLVDKTDEYLPANVVKQIEEALGEKEGALLFQLGTAVKLTKWVKLPQMGTTIQIGLQEFGDEKYKFHLACELTYNETNGTFTFVKK
jgi:hypothetical protein